MKQSTIVAIREELKEIIKGMKKDNLDFSMEEIPVVAIRDKEGYLQGIIPINTSFITDLEGR
ncbi:hypothetical protein BFS06_12275 [Clostridium perfringens]|uniref:Uncharacterized protein n=1 Tax=Clostridium perfringens TaxID=1502 RepID=A0A140GR22_CLOPF|nr:hypothetical protein [Clostridium perfringens]AMN30981.1 hypothetical protein JFP838_pA0065 [Clostridium perfringens]TBX14977.1 hypothetical protein BFS06_12275 [Clostridium perfringens]